MIILNGIELWYSNGSLFIGTESEPLLEENFGPIRKFFFFGSLPWRSGWAAYLDIFSG